MLVWALIAGSIAAMIAPRFLPRATVQPSVRRERVCLTIELIKRAEADALSRQGKTPEDTTSPRPSSHDTALPS